MTRASAASIAAALRDQTAVTILCHMRPDPDTIGSGLALGLALQGLGMVVEVAFPGTTRLPDALTELPGAKLLVDEDAVVGHPAVVSVDAASLERLENLAGVFERADLSVTIDHHASNGGFGDLDLIDQSADCTAALVLDVLDELGVGLDADIATCLYAGLLTDTGSFRWARPASFRIAARLLEAGVDGRTWSRKLIDSHPFAWFSMVSSVLDSATLHSDAFEGAGLVVAVVDRHSLEGLSWDESESVVDIVRTAREAEVAVVFKEGDPDQWTVSLRSKTADVVGLAQRHGGGGHKHAAGYSDAGTADAVVGRLLDSI